MAAVELGFEKFLPQILSGIRMENVSVSVEQKGRYGTRKTLIFFFTDSH